MDVTNMFLQKHAPQNNVNMDKHLERLRREEVNSVREYFKPGMRVLEIGGGSGFQASIIESLGCHVVSIDIAENPGSVSPYHPVEIYDGQTIPYPDSYFDVVFSSNSLEHISPLIPMLKEIRRVLKKDGIAIHILPSATWRFWTSLTYYVYLIKLALNLIRNKESIKESIPGAAAKTASLKTIKGHGIFTLIRRSLYDRPHGEYPNALSELYYFSRRRWLKTFKNNGFEVLRATGNSIFYTGYKLFPRLPIVVRKRMSHLLGSACHIFVMR